MKTIVWTKASSAQRAEALARPVQGNNTAVVKSVVAIIADVKKRGDEALRDFSVKFDRVRLKNFRISLQDAKTAYKELDPKLRAAIKRAKKNIEIFHKAQYPKSTQIETMPGVTCEWHWRALKTIGLYIPGGTAPLFSTVLMQAIPARIAGCKNLILCTPAQRDGKIHPAVLAAAYLCGVTDIFAVGGAHAIASMAYGTQTIPKVEKIFGPGNGFVTAAKQLVAQDTDGAAIDMPAGPSEVMVIAEKSARPDWVASDLLAQAEHDVLAHTVLVTTSMAFADKVKHEVQKQLAQLPRQATAVKSMAESRMIVVADMKTAISVANLYAPEHLIIHNKDAARYLPKIQNAGSIFLGEWTPESVGDYASGTNHVLPTYGYARAYSGLNVLSFMKSMTVQKLTRKGLQQLGPVIVTMSQAEGLDAHANAVKIRMGIMQ